MYFKQSTYWYWSWFCLLFYFCFVYLSQRLLSVCLESTPCISQAFKRPLSGKYSQHALLYNITTPKACERAKCSEANVLLELSSHPLQTFKMGNEFSELHASAGFLGSDADIKNTTSCHLLYQTLDSESEMCWPLHVLSSFCQCRFRTTTLSPCYQIKCTLKCVDKHPYFLLSPFLALFSIIIVVFLFTFAPLKFTVDSQIIAGVCKFFYKSL